MLNMESVVGILRSLAGCCAGRLDTTLQCSAKVIKARGLNAAMLPLSLLLAGCEPDNEHFCARYQYVYNQLLEKGLPPYSEMRQQLVENMNNPKKDKEQARFMLFVLEDWHGHIKPESEPSKDFCLRVQRWQAYP